MNEVYYEGREGGLFFVFVLSLYVKKTDDFKSFFVFERLVFFELIKVIVGKHERTEFCKPRTVIHVITYDDEIVLRECVFV